MQINRKGFRRTEGGKLEVIVLNTVKEVPLTIINQPANQVGEEVIGKGGWEDDYKEVWNWKDKEGGSLKVNLKKMILNIIFL